MDSNSWNLNEAFDSDFNKTVNENTTVYLQKMIEKTQGRSWSAFISEKGIETKLRHVYYKRKSKVENATKARIGFLQKKRRINRKTYVSFYLTKKKTR